MPSHVSPPGTRPLLSVVRNNLLGLIALAFVVAPSSYALAAESMDAKTTRICIINKTGMLRSVASPGYCRTGEKSFFVSRRGVQGLRGVRGDTGAAGAPGATGPAGAVGATGANGSDGGPGPQGAPGAAATLNVANYYALVPGDNPGFVMPGEDIAFPQDGPNQGTITRASSTTFVLPAIGIYRVAFGASIGDYYAQLQLTLNDVGVPQASFSRFAGGSLLGGEALITTSVADSSITVRNASYYPAQLVNYSGPDPAVAYITIQQLG